MNIRMSLYDDCLLGHSYEVTNTLNRFIILLPPFHTLKQNLLPCDRVDHITTGTPSTKHVWDGGYFLDRTWLWKQPSSNVMGKSQLGRVRVHMLLC